MDLLALPDIAGMLILMGVLNRLRRKYRDASVDIWMLGLTFILLESIAVAVLRGSPWLSNAAHTLALDAYVLAASTFGWAAREDMLPAPSQVPMLFPPSVPLFVLMTIYGIGTAPASVYLVITSASLLVGVAYLLIFVRGNRRFLSVLIAIHLVLWAPMTWMAYQGKLRMLVYWGLTWLYLLVAVSFRRRVRRDGVGGVVIVTGFVVWAFCFLAHPFVRDKPMSNGIVETVWTMQKFFVIIGMVLVLLEEQTRRLQDEAMHDALTGLPNRRLFNDRLVQAIERARRTGRSAAVFVVDLDNFKAINDTQGHSSGDDVLASAAQVLKSKIRSSDTLARCGGDEFNVIVNDLTRAFDCERIAAVLRSAVSTVEVPPGFPGPLTGSVGYALFPDDVSDADELCELADVRMYKDKRTKSSKGIVAART
jgi:diguanylate cyclase (GGDEF)-like protein